jgi:serine/threonine protein kinase
MWQLLIAIKANECMEGTLAEQIQNKTLDATSTGCAIRSMVRATYDLHAKGVKDLSLTPWNVFFTSDWMAKISDLDSAREKQADLLQAQRYAAPELLDTLRYSAPELLEGVAPSEESDVWALGLLLYETIALEPAFDPSWGLAKHIRAVSSSERPSIPSTASPELVRVIKSCWEADPTRRMKLAEIMKTLAEAEWNVVGGADAKAVKEFLRKFPLDQWATKEELLAAVAERRRQVAEANQKLAERDGEVAALKRGPDTSLRAPKQKYQAEGWRARMRK